MQLGAAQGQRITTGMISTPMISFGDSKNSIKAMSKRDFGIDINFEAHPNFDKNHSIPVTGVDKITDDFRREDLRRISDEYQTGKQSISNLLQKYDSEIAAAEGTLGQWVMSHPSH